MLESDLPEFKNANEVEQYFAPIFDDMLKDFTLRKTDIERQYARDLKKWHALKRAALAPFEEEDLGKHPSTKVRGL